LQIAQFSILAREFGLWEAQPRLEVYPPAGVVVVAAVGVCETPVVGVCDAVEEVLWAAPAAAEEGVWAAVPAAADEEGLAALGVVDVPAPPPAAGRPGSVTST
jgi:hypothetical protein